MNNHIFIAGCLNPSSLCELRNKIKENKCEVFTNFVIVYVCMYVQADETVVGGYCALGCIGFNHISSSASCISLL